VLGFENSKEYSELVRRVWHGDAPAEVVPPGIVLANDRPEWAWARGELLWQSMLSNGALAANFSVIGIQQLSLERVTVVEAVYLINVTAGSVFFRVSLVSGAFSGQSTLGTRDMRVSNFTGRGLSFNQVGDPLAGTPAAGYAIPAQTTFILAPPRGWTITTNKFGVPNLLVVPEGVNTPVRADFYGYERRLRPEERFEAA